MPFWVPGVLLQHSEVVLWYLLSIQMIFRWICGGESGLPVLFLRHLRTALGFWFWKIIKSVPLGLHLLFNCYRVITIFSLYSFCLNCVLFKLCGIPSYDFEKVIGDYSWHFWLLIPKTFPSCSHKTRQKKKREIQRGSGGENWLKKKNYQVTKCSGKPSAALCKINHILKVFRVILFSFGSD